MSPDRRIPLKEPGLLDKYELAGALQSRIIELATSQETRKKLGPEQTLALQNQLGLILHLLGTGKSPQSILGSEFQL